MAKRRKGENPSQRDMRRTMVLRDQHGRRWSGTVEDDTLHPVGELTPAQDKHGSPEWGPAPIMPPPKYFVFDANEVGFFKIDYDRWLEDLKTRWREWRDQLEFYAQQLYGDAWNKAIRKPPRQLLRLAGKEPPNPDQVRACQAGNAWALGLRKADGTPHARPAWADEVFPVRQSAEDELRNEFPSAEEENEPDFGERITRGMKSGQRFQPTVETTDEELEELEQLEDEENAGVTSVRAGVKTKTKKARR